MGNAHPLSRVAPAAALDVAALRAQFPVLQQSIHGHALAYLDNAATTHMPLAVMEAMRRFETHERANIHRGVHTLSQRATDAFEQARATLKRFIGADAGHELVFTSGTTESLNLVAQGLWGAGPGQAWLRPGDRIISTGLEHHANLVPWQHAARMSGAELVVLRPDAQGRLQQDALAALLTPRTRVLAITASANATGERPPYEAMLAMARQAGALTVLDAAQAVGHGMPALSALACDFMARASGGCLPMASASWPFRRISWPSTSRVKEPPSACVICASWPGSSSTGWPLGMVSTVTWRRTSTSSRWRRFIMAATPRCRRRPAGRQWRASARASPAART